MSRYQPKDYLREALKWSGPDGTVENGYLLQRELGKFVTVHTLGAFCGVN